MQLIKLEYQLQLIVRMLFRINKHFFKIKTYGNLLTYIFSIVMEFADGGDLYQKISQYKKNK